LTYRVCIKFGFCFDCWATNDWPQSLKSYFQKVWELLFRVIIGEYITPLMECKQDLEELKTFTKLVMLSIVESFNKIFVLKTSKFYFNSYVRILEEIILLNKK
jgi:hypothetical protein